MMVVGDGDRDCYLWLLMVIVIEAMVEVVIKVMNEGGGRSFLGIF